MKAETHASRADVGASEHLPRAVFHTEYRGRSHAPVPTIVRSFDSLTAFADSAEHVGNIGVTDLRTDDDAECGSLADALRMARGDGWDGVANDAAAIAERVNAIADGRVLSDDFTYRYDVVGSEVDLGRFMEGNPECALDVVIQPVARRGKVVRIIVPVCYSWNVKTPLIMRRGAAVLALIDALARCHYSLEIWACVAIHSQDSRQRLVYAIKVQDPATTYDPALIAFGLGHPAMLRKLGFMVEEHENEATRKAFGIPGGYGRFPFDCVEADLTDVVSDGPMIVLPALQNGGLASDLWTDDARVAEWIETQIAAIVGA